MGDMVVNMLDGTFQKCIQTFFDPIKDLFGLFTATPEVMDSFIKLFAGNLLVQILQIAIVIAMIIYRATDKDLASIFSFVITVSMIRILEKLEDIVRDASVNVGIGRDVSSAIQKVQGAIYATTQTTQVINAAKMIFGRPV